MIRLVGAGGSIYRCSQQDVVVLPQRRVQGEPHIEPDQEADQRENESQRNDDDNPGTVVEIVNHLEWRRVAWRDVRAGHGWSRDRAA